MFESTQASVLTVQAKYISSMHVEMCTLNMQYMRQDYRDNYLSLINSDEQKNNSRVSIQRGLEHRKEILRPDFLIQKQGDKLTYNRVF